MTKPLQGALFRKFRDQIMGVIPAQDPKPMKDKQISRTQMKSKAVSFSLVHQEGRHHRSVLGTVMKHMKDRQLSMIILTQKDPVEAKDPIEAKDIPYKNAHEHGLT